MADLHIATIPKNKREEIRVTLGEFNGHQLFNVRDVNDLLLIKPKGVYENQTAPNGRPVIFVHRPDRPEETIFCLSPGHANQVRQSLTDEGLVGLVGNAL